MEWTEVDIFTTTEAIELLCYKLSEIGITGFQICDKEDFKEFLDNKYGKWDYIDDELMGLSECETKITVYLPQNSQGADMLTSIRTMLSALKASDTENRYGRLEAELSSLREEDWANNWKQYFKPFKVGERLAVKPSWEDYVNDDNRVILEIDPASSFGTGQHNTTQLCLELVEKYLGENDRVLDLGCGSGILSIGAVLLGADECTAIDIDANSVKIAGENAEKNNIPAEKYHAICGNVIDDSALVAEIGTGFDMVCANIVADVLIGMSGLFKGFLKQGGRLIVSGIIDMRKDEVLDVIKAQGFVLDEIREKEDWVAASFKAP